MSVFCRFCDSEYCVKHGFIGNEQRYFCKTCRRHFILRPKSRGYTASIKINALMQFKKGYSHYAVAQVLAVSYTAVKNWFLNPFLTVKKLVEEEMYQENQTFEVVSLAELQNYIQKNATKFEYGLLLLVPQERLFPSKLILAGRHTTLAA